MPYEIFKRPQAARDIEECFVYIAEDNLDAGVTFLVAVEDAIEQLARFPLLGKARQFADRRIQNVRMWKVKNFENYLIFYTVAENRIEVVRILHSARDIEDLFS
jgi:toxin ParE1/3/4